MKQRPISVEEELAKIAEQLREKVPSWAGGLTLYGSGGVELIIPPAPGQSVHEPSSRSVNEVGGILFMAAEIEPPSTLPAAH